MRMVAAPNRHREAEGLPAALPDGLPAALPDGLPDALATALAEFGRHLSAERALSRHTVRAYLGATTPVFTSSLHDHPLLSARRLVSRRRRSMKARVALVAAQVLLSSQLGRVW